MSFKITKAIEVNMACRIPKKNKNLHGNRYKVVVELRSAGLIEEGSREGMVEDFRFVKEWMMNLIHSSYNNTLMLYVKDPLAKKILKESADMIGEYKDKEEEQKLKDLYLKRDEKLIKNWEKVCLLNDSEEWNTSYHTSLTREEREGKEIMGVCDSENFKFYGLVNFLGFIPTAENLARYWFYKLNYYISNKERKNMFVLNQLQVWETPTCSAIFYRRN